MKCPKCQAENPEDAKFCNQCASVLELTCPSCGKLNLPDSRFCNQCACDLSETKAPASVDYSKPQSYTPKFLADKILKDRSCLEGERKLVTVLFADTASYTSMSEKLDTEEVRQIMDGCFRVLMDEIHKYEGTITQFTGDGVMALFGAPVAHEDHALRACYATLSIQKALESYGDRVKRDCGVDFKMRIGLNSGRVIVGSVGTDLKMEYTAVGDTVNLASRMQTMAEPGGILVAPATYRMARDFFQFRPVGKVKVKGKEEPVEAYQLLKAAEVATRIEAAVVRGLTRFVGRDREMATLGEALDKAKSGTGQVVGVVGEAGVGKSRLLFELRKVLPEGEYTYLQGRCLHYGGSMPYLPFLDILRGYFGIEEGDREYLVKKKMAEKVAQLDEKLKEALPPIEDILSLKVEDEAYLKLDAPLKRVKIFEAIRDVLIRESQNKPLVLAVEDLHWIDKTSEEFLGYLIGFLANTPILLLLLYRPEYTHQWASKSYYRQIGVDQLSLPSSAELVQSILEEGEVAPELKNLILTTAAGNPLFMEEFTHALLENGSIKKKDSQYILSRKPSEIHVPDTIQAIIAARMDRLEDNLKRTMQVASVIGRDFAFRILQTITGMREDLKSHLVNLQGLEFIYEKSLFPELEYIFKHALIQEVAYNSLLIKRRKEIHQRIGKAIEDIYAERSEEFYEMLAHHYVMAENWEKAVRYLKLSGQKASLSFSLREAVGYYKQAITILLKMPDTEENKRAGIEIRLLMDFPLFGLGFPGDSVEIFQEGERLSRELGDGKSEANFQTILSCCSTSKGRAPEGLSWGETAFRRAELLDDVDLMVASGFEVCQCAVNLGQFRKVVEVSAKCIAVLEETQRQADYYGRPFNTYSALLAMRGAAMGMMGRFKEAEECCEKSLRFLRTIDNRYGLAMAQATYGMVLAVKGDGGRSLEHSREALQHCEATQFLTITGTACNGLGMAHLCLGDIEAARLYLDRAIKTNTEAGIFVQHSISYFLLGMVLYFAGDLASARRCAEEALRVAQSNAERAYEGMSWFLLGAVLGAADLSQSGRAEEYLLKGVAIEEEIGARPFSCVGHFFLGQHYANRGHRDKASEHLTTARAMSEEMGMGFWMTLAQSSLDGLSK
jgi:class 3 adenylate cyclase/tetratricopeptide (TPR) repeat protein